MRYKYFILFTYIERMVFEFPAIWTGWFYSYLEPWIKNSAVILMLKSFHNFVAKPFFYLIYRLKYVFFYFEGAFFYFFSVIFYYIWDCLLVGFFGFDIFLDIDADLKSGNLYWYVYFCFLDFFYSLDILLYFLRNIIFHSLSHKGVVLLLALFDYFWVFYFYLFDLFFNFNFYFRNSLLPDFFDFWGKEIANICYSNWDVREMGFFYFQLPYKSLIFKWQQGNLNTWDYIYMYLKHKQYRMQKYGLNIPTHKFMRKLLVYWKLLPMERHTSLSFLDYDHVGGGWWHRSKWSRRKWMRPNTMEYFFNYTGNYHLSLYHLPFIKGGEEHTLIWPGWTFWQGLSRPTGQWRIFNIGKPLWTCIPIFCVLGCFFSKGFREYMFGMHRLYGFDEPIYMWSRFRNANIKDLVEPLHFSYKHAPDSVFDRHLDVKFDRPKRVVDVHGKETRVTLPFFTWDEYTFVRMCMDVIGKKLKDENIYDFLARQLSMHKYFSNVSDRIKARSILKKFLEQGEEWRLWNFMILGRENFMEWPPTLEYDYNEKTDRYKSRWVFHVKNLIPATPKKEYELTQILTDYERVAALLRAAFWSDFGDYIKRYLIRDHFHEEHVEMWNYFYNDVYDDFYRIDRIDESNFLIFKKYMESFNFSSVKACKESEALDFELRQNMDIIFKSTKDMHDKLRSFFFKVDKEIFGFNLPRWAFHRKLDFSGVLELDPFKDSVFNKLNVNEFITDKNDYNLKHRATLSLSPSKYRGTNISASNYYGLYAHPYAFDSLFFWLCGCLYYNLLIWKWYGFHGISSFIWWFELRLYACVLFGGFDFAHYVADVTSYSSIYLDDDEYNPATPGQGTFRFHYDPYFSNRLLYGSSLSKSYPEGILSPKFYLFRLYYSFIFPLFFGHYGLSGICDVHRVFFIVYYLTVLYIILKAIFDAMKPQKVYVNKVRWLSYQDLLKLNSYFKLKKKLRRSFLWFWR
jgi:hypothetical protein